MQTLFSVCTGVLPFIFAGANIRCNPKSTSIRAHTYNYFPGTYTYRYAYTQNGDQWKQEVSIVLFVSKV